MARTAPHPATLSRSTRRSSRLRLDKTTSFRLSGPVCIPLPLLASPRDMTVRVRKSDILGRTNRAIYGSDGENAARFKRRLRGTKAFYHTLNLRSL